MRPLFISFVVCSLLCTLFAAHAEAVRFRLAVVGDPAYPTSYFYHSGQDYMCGNFTYYAHQGSDVGIGGFTEMDKGRDVVAAAGGTVMEAHDGEADRCTSGNCSPPNGNYVKLKHDDGKITYYLHLRKWSVAVSTGQRVLCGQKIGQVGSSGYSTGPHLHFQVWTPDYGTDDPFAGPCGGPLTYWVNQGAYMGLPGRTCDPASCGTMLVPKGGDGQRPWAATLIFLVPVLFAMALKKRVTT